MKTKRTIVVLCVLAIFAAVAFAAPYGPDSVTRVLDQRRTDFDAGVKQVQAQAGNVTQLSINTSIITDRWQGYYGNISGKITLDNSEGWTLYDWSSAELAVVGEIYAANNTVTSWSDVICVNFSGNGINGQQGINLTRLESMYGAATSDADGFDETFTTTESMVIGTTTLSSCPATHLYINNASQAQKWNETLLTENATGTLIFASEVEQNIPGFNNATWDFQMLVAENGDTVAATTYYFYVELV